jgi:phosphatidylserine/phosphatidylglycerophosphate/cardiolipin synthase-like enzyme
MMPAFNPNAPGSGSPAPFFPKAFLPKAVPLTIGALDQFKTAPVVTGYPTNFRSLYAPVDEVKPALAYLLAAAQHSLIVCMFGFDDDDLADIIKQKLSDPAVFVQLTLDKTQAAGAHEKLLLEKMNYPASSIAIGHSEHGRIIHTKMVVIDGLFVVGGSTNWSVQAETLQDNELTVLQDPYVAAEATARLSRVHSFVLQASK